jgi:septal ring factor EnvC (AmiA/AmiB activator)
MTFDRANRKPCRRTLRMLVALACCLAFALPAQEPDRNTRETEAQQKLDAIRVEIKTLTEAQRNLDSERSEATAAVRDADEAIDREARALRDIETRIESQQAELATLEQQKTTLEASLGKQREALAALLRSAYALGRHEQVKLLLAQDRLDALARVLAYHRYFQRDRVGRIETLLDELKQLAAVVQAVLSQREALAASRDEQTKRIAELEIQREDRRTLLANLEQQFSDAQGRLVALGRDEKSLVGLLESLRDVFADIPKQLDDARPFVQRRGGLSRPHDGKLLANYGGRLPDGRISQGLLIGGSTGDAVRAVAPGRVAFADWLKGYGLIVILDHGDGYMSLYAQNDTLQKDVGDWVAAGETLAGVGTSGGQSQPALYFELRRNGRPVDLRAWFAKR